jgi:hypothetical protein
MAAKKKTTTAKAVLNPFEAGVSYDAFLKSLPTGKTPREALKGKCTDAQLDWLETELKHFKKK